MNVLLLYPNSCGGTSAPLSTWDCMGILSPNEPGSGAVYRPVVTPPLLFCVSFLHPPWGSGIVVCGYMAVPLFLCPETRESADQCTWRIKGNQCKSAIKEFSNQCTCAIKRIFPKTRFNRTENPAEKCVLEVSENSDRPQKQGTNKLKSSIFRPC